jgi:outer membrane putative beta-barrel porin/alpha-amylase
MQRVSFRRKIAFLTGRRNSIQFPSLVPRLAALLAALVWIMSMGSGKTWAGPPFVTDDPEPVDYKHGEFYVATQYAKDKDVTSGTAPHFELNYGVVPDVQLHLITPFVYVKPEGEPRQRGYGDTEAGIKYRFINDEDSHFMAGTFPIVTLPTGDSDKGLGAGHTRFFLPLWLQKAWGPWQTYGGGGYWRNPGEGSRDYWFFGWQVQRAMSAQLTVGAELFTQTRDADDAKARTGFNVGAIVNVTDDHHLLFSVGSDINGDNRVSAYLAYQYTFGPHEGKK